MQHATILAALVISEIEAASSLGADPEALMAASGIEPAWLDDPDGRIPITNYLQLWEKLTRAVDGLQFGLHIGLIGVGGVGLAMRHGATVRAALAWLQRYGHVVHPDIGPRIDHRRQPAGERVVFTHDVPPPFLRLREPVYAYAAALMGTMNSLCGRSTTPAYVAYPLSRAADPERHERFFACPVSWGAAALEVAFDAALLDLPIAGSDPRLFSYLSRRADALTEALPDSGTFASRVRGEIAQQLSDGGPRLREIAARLAVSERTLHRRLAGESTGFATLVDAVRRERALALLANRSVSCAEVGFMLGYADATAFSRAFKRWMGESPLDYRARMKLATGALSIRR